MFINNTLFAALALGSILFYIGYILSNSIKMSSVRLILTVLFLALALPGVSFILYYLHMIQEPVWYVELRSISNFEVLASLMGLFFGFAAFKKRRVFGFNLKLLNICLFVICMGLIFIPFCKPVLLPLDKSKLNNRWIDGVCLQSVGSTCGPSSFATVFLYYGISRSEKEISQGAYSCSSGTENWYLIRYARKNGLKVECMYKDTLQEVPFPSIIGTRIGQLGHFITVFGKESGKYIIGDSLKGRLLLSQREFDERYAFEGFVMHVTKP